MLRMKSLGGAAITASAALFSSGLVLGQEADKLGQVTFATSCTQAAQERFDRALALQHSFWYQASYKGFSEVLPADPRCAIAYWGLAMSRLFNPFSAPPAKNLADGLAAVESGKKIGAKTERERDYIAAIGAFYTDHDKLDHRTRVASYVKAMEGLSRKYAEDSEAQIFYALALNVAASPADKTYANQLKAAAILEKEFARQPNHPGVAHYLIHTYDYPAIAPRGLTAAKRYAKIAPSAPHALHMPSHIFTRVGQWQDSIDTNAAAASVAAKNKEPNDQLHAMDYMVYAYLQTGRDKKAREVVAEMAAVRSTGPVRNAAPYAKAASAARYVIERGAWPEATLLKVEQSRFGYVDAITYFAKGLGAARSGQSDAAKQSAATLGELRDKLRQAKDAYWTEQVEIQRQVVLAWAAHAEGKHDAAVAAMRAAAEAEDRTDKHPITPGPLAPARELLGEMLLDRNAARDALAAFEATLQKEPGRLRATFGAARAAELAGDPAKAKTYYDQLLALARSADTERVELTTARKFLAKN